MSLNNINQTKPNLFPGHNHLLSTGTDDLTLITKVKGHQHRWLAGGYNLEIGHFRSSTMVVTWWIVAFRRTVYVTSVNNSVYTLCRLAVQGLHEV